MKCLASLKSTPIKRERERTVEFTVHTLMVALASVLTDKLNYGKPKVMQILKMMNDRADSINKGYINIEDLEQTLRDEYEIVILKRGEKE